MQLEGKVALVTGASRGIGAAIAVQADVSDAGAVEGMVRAATEQLGPVDILVNNAGITRDCLLLRMKDSDWDAVLATNLTGACRCARAVAAGMLKRRGGRIVSISSVVGLMGNAGQANYAAAKAGLIGLTRALARELAGRGITVNAVAPGFIDTDMTAAMPEKARERLLATVPLGRLGRPEEVADAVLFLAGPGAAYITGQVLSVNGGMLM